MSVYILFLNLRVILNEKILVFFPGNDRKWQFVRYKDFLNVTLAKVMSHLCLY